NFKKRGWLFSQSFEGAKARAIIMSLLETAKRHQLNSEKYLSYLLESQIILISRVLFSISPRS
ncbi:TPA: IS66 family transposase, partial [Streptococcus pneumoniae]